PSYYRRKYFPFQVYFYNEAVSRIVMRGSDGLDQPEVEAVGLGEIHQHLGATVADRHGAAGAAVDDIASSAEQRPELQRAGAFGGRLQETQALIVGLGNRAAWRRVGAEHGVIPAQEIVIGARADPGEIAGGAEQVLGVVGPDAEQHRFVHGAGKPQRGRREARFGKCPVEGDAVGSDQRNQDDVGLGGSNAGKMCGMIVLADRNELLADQLPAGLRDVSLDRTMRLPGPDIIAADEIPARGLLDVGEPVNRRPALPARRLADRHHARRALAALVDWGIDVGHPTARHLAQCNAHRADMRAHDHVDFVEGDRLFGAADDVADRPAGVEHRHFDLAAKDAAALVDLGGREQHTVDRGRTPDAGRAGACEEIGDPQLAMGTTTLDSAGIGGAPRWISRKARRPLEREGWHSRTAGIEADCREHAHSCPMTVFLYGTTLCRRRLSTCPEKYPIRKY